MTLERLQGIVLLAVGEGTPVAEPERRALSPDARRAVRLLSMFGGSGLICGGPAVELRDAAPPCPRVDILPENPPARKRRKGKGAKWAP